MAISAYQLLGKYFSVEEIRDVLADISESTTGNKEQIIRRLVIAWPKHNRTMSDLLEFLDQEGLISICYDFKLDEKGDDMTLIRRIARSGIIKGFEKKPAQESENESSSISVRKDLQHPNSLLEMITGNKKTAAIIAGVIGAVLVGSTIAANFANLMSIFNTTPTIEGKLTILRPAEGEVFPWPDGNVSGTYDKTFRAANIYVWIHRQDCQPGKCAYFPFKAIKNDDGTWRASNVEAGDCANESLQEVYAIMTDRDFPKYNDAQERYMRFDTSWLDQTKPSDLVVVKRLPVSCP